MALPSMRPVNPGRMPPQSPANRPSLFAQMIGNRKPRFNRFFETLKASTVLLKVPQNVGVDEYNEVLGIGRTPIALGATVAINVTAPRDLILRKIQLGDVLAPANLDWMVTAIAVEGNACVLGGGAGGLMWGPNNFNPITFDLPVTGGTSITITVQNTGPAAGGIAIAGGLVID